MKTANLEASVEPRVHPRACRTWNRQGNRGPLVSPTINRVDRFLDSLHERPDTRNGTDPVLRPVKSPQRLLHRPAPVRLPAFSLTCHLFVLPREFPLRSYTRRSLYVLSFSLSLSVCLSFCGKTLRKLPIASPSFLSLSSLRQLGRLTQSALRNFFKRETV